MQNFLHIRRTAKIWPIMRMSPLYPYVGNSFFRPVYSEASKIVFVLDQNVHILFSNVCLSSSSALYMLRCTYSRIHNKE